MKNYVSPEWEIVEFRVRDIIRTSCDPFDDIPCGESGCGMEGIGCTPGMG